MATIQEIRQKYPQYDDLSDQQLADSFHSKFYSDIPKEQFYQTLGVGQPKIEQAPKEESFQEANQRRLGQAAMGLPQGLGNLAVGATQLVTDLVAPNSQFAKNLAEEAEKLKQKQSELPTSERVGIALGETLPFLSTGAGTGLKVAQMTGSKIAGLGAASAIGSGASTLLAPQEESGLGKRAEETVKSGAIGGVLGLGLGAGASAVTGAPALVKKGIQKIAGITPKSEQTLKAFEVAGVNPTLANITEGGTTKTFQNLVANFPGGRGVIEKATQDQVDNITKQIAGITKSQGGTIPQAGKTIQEGAQSLTGKLQARTSKLYDKLDQFVPESLPTNKVRELLDDPQIQDVVAVGSGDTSKVIKRYQDIVDESGNVPYSRLKSFRSTIGAKLQSPSLLGDERSALKRIYGALSQDMKDAVVNTSGSKGLEAFERANKTFSRTQDILESKINPLIEAKTPTKVYNLVMSGTKQGGTDTRYIMKTLTPEQKDFVRGTVAREMGLANEGVQGAERNAFSADKFLTEYNKMQKIGTEKDLFTPQQNAALKDLNKAIESIKQTGKVKQTSNNLPYFVLGGLSMASLPGAAGSVAGANISAKMMTNPTFLKWLAKSPNVGAKEIPAYIRQLSVIGSKNPDIREDILDYLGSITSNPSTEQEQ